MNDDKIQMILRQTNYSEEEARELLNKFENDEMLVIRYYIKGDVITKKKEEESIKSLNQAIYKTIRTHLDNSMKTYMEKVEKGEAKII